MYFKNLLRIQVIGSDWLAQAGDFAQWSGFFPSVRIVGLMSYSKHAQVQRETCGSRQTSPLPPVLIFVCSNWDFARVHGNPSLFRSRGLDLPMAPPCCFEKVFQSCFPKKADDHAAGFFMGEISWFGNDQPQRWKKNMEGTQNRTPKQKLWKSWNRYTMKLMRIGVLGGQGGYWYPAW